jgi:MSHA biogenesis protein MshQ
VSFPSLLSLLLAGGRLRRRRALPAWLPALSLLAGLLAGLLGSGIAQATVYNFNGNPVDTCTLSGTVYTCPYPAYLAWDDSVVIGSGYTLKVTNNVTVTYNQGLTMSSNARLIVTGNLDITGINPANLKVSGGQIEAGGTFSMGALPQSITGNVTAGAIQLGTDKVTITGNLVSTGVVNISAGSRITGNVSGAVVSTGTPVTITGNVTATSKFTLGSGSSVTGAVTAPVFDMLASGSRITGNIVASTSMTMGSGNTVTGNISTGTFDMQDSGSKVTGDIVATGSAAIGSGGNVTGNVDTGDLLLRSSSAVITGNARVNWATLEWAGRVTGTIYCKNGTARNKCDCVTNNSGYAVNTTNGPRCEGLAPRGPHHLLLTHDGEGDTCVPEKITVTACANAACTAPHYSGAVSGELAPFGTDFRIPANAGSVVVEVKRYTEGSVTLGVDATTTCYRTSTNSNSCAMNFAGGAKLLVDVPDHTAGADNIKAALQAVKANDSKTACVPAFASVSYPVQFSCNYSKPKTGSLALGLGVQSLACAASGATATAKSVNTAFDADGKATLPLKYMDAGELRLRAYVDTQKGMTASGEGTFITAPAAFALAPDPIAAPIRAGADFKLKVTAVNLAGATTKNFDTNDLNNAGATAHSVALDVDCHMQGGSKGLLSATPSFVDGVATVTATWSEVGRIDLRASLGNFMGSGLSAAGTTDDPATGCSGTVGPFIPAYYKVALIGTRGIYYSGEPFPVRISAMNKAGEVTTNYRGALGEDVTLSANDKNGTAFVTAPGALKGDPDKGDTVKASEFSAGVAETTRTYTFSASPGGPAEVRLRASNGKAAGLDVTSALPATAETAIPLIRSGRLRIGNRFGSLKSTLSIPVTAEYWTGKSWLLHSDDQSTAIPQASFAFRPTVAGLETAPVFAPGPLKLVNGSAAFNLRVTQGGPGPVDIAVNLGATDYDDACIGDTAGTKVKTSPAAIPWLRPWVSGCGAGQPRDPSGRATFGVYTPENRRIIHVREVFN